MALAPRRLPRGINFLLGGIVATICILGVVLSTGGFGFKIGGAPSVQIEDAAASE
ncbi:hypothetical protein [Jannaschia pohangensis]|uniref:hypothetical protein n=1 Tax=Jannaschia pohangensis TaxID=390807 RepID=UPI0015878FBD|nr:hypothetical protein [Jannaschia pohangensis]